MSIRGNNCISSKITVTNRQRTFDIFPPSVTSRILLSHIKVWESFLTKYGLICNHYSRRHVALFRTKAPIVILSVCVVFSIYICLFVLFATVIFLQGNDSINFTVSCPLPVQLSFNLHTSESHPRKLRRRSHHETKRAPLMTYILQFEESKHIYTPWEEPVSRCGVVI